MATATKTRAPATRRSAASRQRPSRPAAGGGTPTYEKLVQVAGEVLADTGFEKLSSKAICARAGVTPPTFYHYFDDKYEVLEELAERLLRKQNDAFGTWVSDYAAGQQPVPPLEAIERCFVVVTQFVSDEPGGIWTIRALRALPNLSHVRLRWQRQYTDQIFEAARRFVPKSAWPLLWNRIRILVEFSYVVDKLVYEEDRIPRKTLIRKAARLIAYFGPT